MAFAAGGLAAVVLVAVTAGGDGSEASAGPVRTATVGTRDLVTTLEASGLLERSSERTIAFAGALTTAGGAALPDGGASSGGTEPVALRSDDSGGSGSTTTSTTDPCRSDGGTTSTTAATSASPMAEECPPESTTSTSTTSTTSSTAPDPPTTASTSPSSTSSTARSRTPTTPEPVENGTPADPAQPSRAGAGAGAAPGATPTKGGANASAAPGATSIPSQTEEVSATLTGLLDVGAGVDRGTVLYTADDEPVAALIGVVPAWRTLESGVDGGADVRQVEENLVALGYGANVIVDEEFTSATAAAVEAWETDLGRADPDGVVEVGDVVFLTTGGDVLGHDAQVGDTVGPGTPVLTIGSLQQVVVATVDADQAAGWAAGSTVELAWADGTTTPGTVFGVGRTVEDGAVELVVTPDQSDTGRLSGAEATITLVDAHREGVVAVPASAIVDHEGSPAVRVAGSNPDDPADADLVPVETGLVAAGWVEITAGLDGGELIVLPS